MKKNSFLLLIYIGFIFIAGFVFILWVIPSEAGVNPDSTVYIGGAKGLLTGNGYSDHGIPITHYPPLYSTLLAITGFFTTNLIHAAHFLNALLFGIDMALVSLIVYFAAGRNYMITTIAILLFASLEPILFLYSWVWSEPLFITFSLACIILLNQYFQKPTLFAFIASSIFLGLTLITRYIGIAFLPAALFMILLGEGGLDFRRRIRNAFLWGILACVPLGILIIRNMMVAGSATNRSLIFHPASHFILRFITSLYYFISPTTLPDGLRPVLFGFLFAMVLTPFVIFFFRHPKHKYWRSIEILMAVSCFLFFIFYLVFLYISISLFDFSTPPDLRILSPIFLIAIVGLFPAFWKILQKLNKRILWWSSLLVAVICISIQIPEAIRSTVYFQQNGYGNTSFTSRQWQDSKSVAFTKLLPEDVNIYSNGPEAVGFLTFKHSKSIPQKFSSTSMEVNPHYNDEIEGMCKDINENGAVLVYFNLVDWKWHLPTQEEIESACQLPVLQRFMDGAIYGKKFY